MKRYFIGLALTVALFGAGQAQALIIDNFDSSNPPGNCGAYLLGPGVGQCVTQPGAAAGTPTSSSNTLSGPNFLGGTPGTRAFSLTITSGTGLRVKGGANIENVDGLNYDNPAGTDSKFDMVWTPTVGSVDLTEPSPTLTDPATYLVWFIQSLDLNLLATVILTDSDGTIGGNAFLKLPGEVVPDICHSVTGVPLVCVQPTDTPSPHSGPPGNLYHLLDLFNTGGTDPATMKDFFDDPYNGGLATKAYGAGYVANTLLDPANNPGGTAGIDFTAITKIEAIFDTAGNVGSPGIDLTEGCFGTSNLLGTQVGSDQQAAPGNRIGQPDFCVQAQVVPEPSTVLLMGTGLLGVGLVSLRSRFIRRRRQA